MASGVPSARLSLHSVIRPDFFGVAVAPQLHWSQPVEPAASRLGSGNEAAAQSTPMVTSENPDSCLQEPTATLDCHSEPSAKGFQIVSLELRYARVVREGERRFARPVWHSGEVVPMGNNAETRCS